MTNRPHQNKWGLSIKTFWGVNTGNVCSVLRPVWRDANMVLSYWHKDMWMITRGEEGLWIMRAGNIAVSGHSAIFPASARLCRRRDLPEPADPELYSEPDLGGMACTTANYGEDSPRNFNRDPCSSWDPRSNTARQLLSGNTVSNIFAFQYLEQCLTIVAKHNRVLWAHDSPSYFTKCFDHS